jgi:hypothetical protein
VLVEETPDFRRYEVELDDGTVIRRTEHKTTAQLLDQNARALNDSMGQRWGDGKVVASIPLNLFYASGVAEATRQKDKRFLSKWLNDADHAKFRTFGGKV